MTGSPSYKVELADAEYFRQSIKCQYACPVGTDAGGYVRAIARGDFEAAYLIARGPNPLASICGRICGAPCEAACRRGDIDKPIAIRVLKRFLTERGGPEVAPRPIAEARSPSSTPCSRGASGSNARTPRTSPPSGI